MKNRGGRKIKKKNGVKITVLNERNIKHIEVIQNIDYHVCDFDSMQYDMILVIV